MTKVIIPPNILVSLSGAWRCDTNKSKTKLYYVDGSTESVKTKNMPPTDWDNWFSIVGSVQSLRGKP